VDVDGAVSRMRAPLLTLQARVSNVKADTGGALSALQDGLRRRAALAERRATLQLMVDASHGVAKVERLLHELAAVAPPGGADAAADDDATAPASAALLERATAEMARLQLLATQGASLPFVAALVPRCDAAGAALRGALRVALRRALRRGDASAARDALGAFGALADAAAAEALVAESFVRPLVRDAIAAAAPAPAADADDVAAAAAVAASSELAPLFAAARGALETHAAFLLALARGPEAPRGLALAARAVLPEVDAAVAAARPGAFSAGRPAGFRANHAAALDFIAWLERAACAPNGDGDAQPPLRSSPAAESMLKRFNLGAYFSLRFADVAGALEAQLPSAPPPSATGVAPLPRAARDAGVSLAASAAAMAALRRVWADDVYVPALADKFLTLALQVASRYATWLAAGALRRARADAEAAAAAAAGAPSGADAAAAPMPAPPLAAAAVAASPALAAAASAAARSGGGDWAAAAPPDDLAAAAADADMLAAALRGDEYGALVAAALAHAPEEARAAAAAALAEAADTLRPPADALASAAASALAERCVEVLRQLRGITATYRMTNKPMPTRHSHFVPGVLAPLRAFLDASPPPPEAKARLVAAVAEAVTVRYAMMRCVCVRFSDTCWFAQSRYDDLARDLVTTVRKTESSLKRLKDRRGGTGPAPAAAAAADVSDTDKICRQLALDAAEYARQLARFGVDAAAMPSFASLWQAVAAEGEAMAF